MPFDVQRERVGPYETVLYAPAKPRRVDRAAAAAAAGAGAGAGGAGRGGHGGAGAGPAGGSTSLAAGSRRESGHVVTLQLAGFEWIDGVPADALGKASFSLEALERTLPGAGGGLPGGAEKGGSAGGPGVGGRASNPAPASPAGPGSENAPRQGRGADASAEPASQDHGAAGTAAEGGPGTGGDGAGGGGPGAGGAPAMAREGGGGGGDWREEHMRRLVCETVRSVNGGREVTLRSCFRLRNSTGHAILVARARDHRLDVKSGSR